jgi:hypothetical protein
MTIKQGTPTLSPLAPTALAGAFEIDTGSDFPNPNDTYLIGMGKVDGNGIVTPVASVRKPTSTRITIVIIAPVIIPANPTVMYLFDLVAGNKYV